MRRLYASVVAAIAYIAVPGVAEPNQQLGVAALIATAVYAAIGAARKGDV